MAKRSSRKSKKTIMMIAGVLGVAVVSVGGYILYKRSKQPGLSGLYITRE